MACACSSGDGSTATCLAFPFKSTTLINSPVAPETRADAERDQVSVLIQSLGNPNVRYGASVALISDAPLGGDCTWTGCVPSKTLIEAASRGDSFHEAMDRVHDTVARIAATPGTRPFECRCR